jgi:uncharacterized protein
MQDLENILGKTVQFVKETLAGAEAGHDWFHIDRVYKNALAINSTEDGNLLIVTLAALLHDIADSKFNNGDEEIGPQKAGMFMESIGISNDIIFHVQQIIRNMSYKASLGELNFSSKELDIVQDADRLDAIGAIGIGRAFTYGGYKNRTMYDPEVAPDLNMSKETYKNSSAPTINHFYEKLLRLKDLMKTVKGQQLALRRHEFMVIYLQQFYREWEGNS